METFLKAVLKQTAKSMLPTSLRRAAYNLIKRPTKWNKKDPSHWPLITPTTSIEKYEYSLYSQNGEDGIIRYIFNEIGTDSKYFIEFGFGALESNSHRLAINEDFGGLFIDGSIENCSLFNKQARKYNLKSVKAINSFLDLDNIKSVILENIETKNVDFLSIDVDGNDYWFWKSIDFLEPRVVAIEYNGSFGEDSSVTVPYDPKFNRHEKHKSGLYHGASLAALTKLAESKGYSLVGCDSSGTNAFFIKNNLITKNIKSLSAKEAYRPHLGREKRGISMKEQLDVVQSLPLEQV